MAGVEIQKSNYIDYPEMVTLSVPVELVDLPRGEYTLPSDTSHIDHTVYLGKSNNGTDTRLFWEHRFAVAEPAGTIMSDDRYKETLEQFSVPIAPENTLWRPETTLFVQKFQMVANVESAHDESNNQGQVTLVAAGAASDQNDLPQVSSGNAFTDTLEAAGFPTTPFDYLREDTRYYAVKSNTKLLVNPVFKPLTKVIQHTIAGPLTALSYRVVPEKQLISTIRTNKHEQRA